jgi:purine-binding chemotaxis protein CheW
MEKLQQLTGLQEDEDTQKDQYLIFSVGEELYGIEIKSVTEIIGIQSITRVPELPDYIRGIINLRGRIIPVMDVRLRFKKDEIAYNDRTCVIVVDFRSITVGLIVDSVSEVLSIGEQDIIPPPELTGAGSRYISGIGKVGSDVRLIINCDMLLNDKETEEMAIAVGQ